MGTMNQVTHPELAPLAVALPLSDDSDKLMLTEHFGVITLDGETVEMARSIHGLHFTLQLDGHTETVDLNPVFKAWAAAFVDRAKGRA